MKRLLQAPNLALATLWADQFGAAGFTVHVQRAYASGIVGEIPPDQALPELWIDDERRHAEAKEWFEQWLRPSERRWFCRACSELVEGPFEVCWNCGAPAPE